MNHARPPRYVRGDDEDTDFEEVKRAKLPEGARVRPIEDILRELEDEDDRRDEAPVRNFGRRRNGLR